MEDFKSYSLAKKKPFIYIPYCEICGSQDRMGKYFDILTEKNKCRNCLPHYEQRRIKSIMILRYSW